ncbi:hypothetical protein [Frankia sp. Cppng1_Ct_nod]|uniref:hypothetical protein n=1 Tax=Frankia sp. Cppng1_Ct_nod TaxID=2897162 RepID=UPI002024321E|nr:hypothetical protein [Frankia sp. Cppng1_Ct_nod]
MTTTEATGTRRTPVVAPAYISGGTASGPQLDWEWVEKRLSENLNYWLATTLPDGTPHVRPIWAFWRDGELYFCTVNRCVDYLKSGKPVLIHLESGVDVVIVEGRATQLKTKAENAVISDAYRELLNHETIATDEGVYTVNEGYGGPGYKLAPTKILGWVAPNFAVATRWTFPE